MPGLRMLVRRRRPVVLQTPATKLPFSFVPPPYLITPVLPDCLRSPTSVPVSQRRGGSGAPHSPIRPRRFPGFPFGNFPEISHSIPCAFLPRPVGLSLPDRLREI